jgi:beta,beta-carotene 9',10'-dioxygenase
VSTQSGEKMSWAQDGCYPGEAVFIPNPTGRNEDDGVLLSVVLDTKRTSSFLLMLDARTMTEIARAEIPFPVPMGFHGAFYNKL